MKAKTVLVATLITLSLAGQSSAMMGGGMAGGGTGHGGGSGGHAVGPGYGMAGAGGLKSGMMGWTMRRGALDLLTPLVVPQDAVSAVETFITGTKSTLQISEVWEYQTVYKVELSDANGQKAFDVLADKLTGTVLPEMGFPMMMNASWGKQLHMTPRFAKKLVLTQDDAIAAAQAFVTKNGAVIDYTLAAPEIYPGYYKFHTTDAAGKPGMEIIVNGYNGNIWMNTQLGAPIGKIQ